MSVCVCVCVCARAWSGEGSTQRGVRVQHPSGEAAPPLGALQAGGGGS